MEVVSGITLLRLGMPLSALPRRRVAVAGARDPTPFGLADAREVARLLAGLGCAVVTGMARGVDTAAAEAAAEAGGVVIAVLPRLRALRLPAAAVVAPAHTPRDVRQQLAARSRVAAALSQAVVVPEARYRPRGWGTRYAVEQAVRLGRPAVVLKPRAPDADVWEGYRRLLQLGAAPAETPADAAEKGCRGN